MSTPYDTQWQASAYSLHEPQYDRYNTGYPPLPRTNEHGLPYDSNFLHPKPPHETIDGAALRGRTPSPTPSEKKELGKGAIDWKAMMNWRFWIRREWLWYYVALVVILVLTALMTIYHTQIVDWLTPVTKWLHDLSFGWVVPIAILFVISFPPLFGHEIVAILCGLVWGLWIGFGIVAAGTFIGEVGNFYAFKYCCRSRGEKLERTKIPYACLAKVVRDGGFKIALIARLSAIPGHFTTAVFSTCGMGIIVFSIAAVLSMPKQFITVYLGVILEQTADGTEDTKSKIISDVVLAITTFITILAMWYILREMNKVKPQVIYARRKARQAKLERQQSSLSPTGHYQNPSVATFNTTGGYSYANTNTSDSEIPLTSQATPMGFTPGFPHHTHLQEPSSESAYGPPFQPEALYDPPLHAPQPHRPGPSIRRPDPEDEEGMRNAEPLQVSYAPPAGPPPAQLQPLPSSDVRYGSPSRTPIRYQSPQFAHSPSQRPQNMSRPTPPASPPRQHAQYSSPDQQFPPIPQNPSPSRNPFTSSFDQLTLAPAPSQQQGLHIPEESYDSFHTASPEPMTTDDLRSRISPPPISLAQQEPAAAVVGSQGQQWNHPPPDYSFSGR